jgi:hypothetical protein
MGQAGRERQSGKVSGILHLENILWSLSGFLWDFERLCHVTINL